MSLECIGFQHAFDTKTQRDCHRNPSSLAIKWEPCDNLLCPQRYQWIKVETKLGGSLRIPQPSQEGPVKAKNPYGKFPEILPSLRTPKGSPISTTPKNPLGNKSKDPQESEVEEEGSEEGVEDEAEEGQEPSTEGKGKKPEQEPEPKPMDTGKPQQVVELEYRVHWNGIDYHGFMDPEQPKAFEKELSSLGIKKEDEDKFADLVLRNSHQYPFADRLQFRGIGKFSQPADTTPTPAKSASAAFGSIIPPKPFSQWSLSVQTGSSKESSSENPKDGVVNDADGVGEDRDTGGSGKGDGGDNTLNSGRGGPG